MSTNIVKNDDNTVVLSALIDQDRWQKAQKKAVAKYQKAVNVKGFRRGSVPAGMIRKVVGEQALTQEAVDVIGQDVLNELLEEYNIEPISRAELDYKEKDGTVELSFTVQTAPVPVLGEYKNLGIAKEAVEVTDEQLDAAIANMLQADADSVLVEDKPAEKGNEVEADITVVVEGADKPEFDQKNVKLVLGNEDLLPGLDEALIGKNTGETVNVTLQVPNGEEKKNADVTAVINSIYEVVVPELTDEYAKERFQADSAEAFRAAQKETLEKNAEERAENAYMEAVLKQAVANAEVSIPDVMIEREIDQLVKVNEQNMNRYGISLKQYLEATKTPIESYRENFREEAQSRVKTTLVLDAIANAENVEVTDEDFETGLQDMAESFGISKEEILKILGKKQITDELRIQKAIDALMDVQ
jgi:trigger factor